MGEYPTSFAYSSLCRAQLSHCSQDAAEPITHYNIFLCIGASLYDHRDNSLFLAEPLTDLSLPCLNQLDVISEPCIPPAPAPA